VTFSHRPPNQPGARTLVPPSADPPPCVTPPTSFDYPPNSEFLSAQTLVFRTGLFTSFPFVTIQLNCPSIESVQLFFRVIPFLFCSFPTPLSLPVGTTHVPCPSGRNHFLSKSPPPGQRHNLGCYLIRFAEERGPLSPLNKAKAGASTPLFLPLMTNGARRSSRGRALCVTSSFLVQRLSTARLLSLSPFPQTRDTLFRAPSLTPERPFSSKSKGAAPRCSRGAVHLMLVLGITGRIGFLLSPIDPRRTLLPFPPPRPALTSWELHAARLFV